MGEGGFGLSALLAIDVVTGNRTIVSQFGTVGAGMSFSTVSTVTLNAAEDKAYVTDPNTNNGILIMVDMATGDRTLLSMSGVIGIGPNFAYPVDVKLNGAEDTAYVLNSTFSGTSGSIFAVDLATGDRTEISGDSTGTGPSFAWPQAMVLNAAKDKLYVALASTGSVISVDLATGNRELISK